MMLFYVAAIPAFLVFALSFAQNVPLRGPPQFETNPQYLDSYIPASMQVIAYLTEMMKYDIKPIVITTTTTSTQRPTRKTTRRPSSAPSRVTTKRPWLTAPPTPYHKPALYAPYIPPSFILSRTDDDKYSSYEEYVNRLKNPLGDYFDRYRQVEPSISSIINQLNRQRRATPFEFLPTTKKPVIIRRHRRAKPFVPIQDQNQGDRVVNKGQQFTSLKKSRAKNTPLARSRSLRSVLLDQELTVPSKHVKTAKPPLIVTLTETNKTKARALSINGDSLNARSVDYLGFGLNELIKEIQSDREATENRLTDDDRVKIFSTKYDDVNFASYLLRQKKIPPTKAYVTLLSLYDLLNKESKKLMLNKYNGYATAIIEELIETSTGTSSEQLLIILQRIIDRPDTYDPTIRTKITSLVTDLSTTNSYINDALRYIPPLPFSH